LSIGLPWCDCSAIFKSNSNFASQSRGFTTTSPTRVWSNKKDANPFNVKRAVAEGQRKHSVSNYRCDVLLSPR
jgi:hypothetical protein